VAFGREAMLRPGSIAVALSEGGRPGVCSDDGQLGIGRSNDIGRIRLALLKSFGALRVRAVNSIVAARSRNL
jgi:hypothetical protein